MVDRKRIQLLNIIFFFLFFPFLVSGVEFKNQLGDKIVNAYFLIPDNQEKWVKGGDIYIKSGGHLEIGTNSTLIFEIGHSIKMEGGYISLSADGAQIKKRFLPEYECAKGADCPAGKYCRNTDYTCQNLPNECTQRNEQDSGYSNLPDYTQCSETSCDLCIGGVCRKKRRTSLEINGKAVYCDINGRMWSSTQSRGEYPFITDKFQWGFFTTDLPNDSCIGVYYRNSACTHCDDLVYAGFSDWILPPCKSLTDCILRELGLEVCKDYRCDFRSWDRGGIANFYWSSSENPYDYRTAITVNFGDASGIGTRSKYSKGRVRCVRIGKNPCSGKPDGVSCGDGLVCENERCVEQVCYRKRNGEQCGATPCDFCDSGYCIKVRHLDFSINGDLVFCDEKGRMWTPTADIPTGRPWSSRYIWSNLFGVPPNQSCIGQGDSYPACNYCDSLNYGGFDDWQLAGVNDLCELGKEICGWTSCGGGQSSCLPSWDSGAKETAYWSSDNYYTNPSYAFAINFGNGLKGPLNKQNLAYVRCVRKRVCTGEPDGTPCGECKECRSEECVPVTDGTPCGKLEDCKVCLAGECVGTAPDGTRCYTGDCGECQNCSYSNVCAETGTGTCVRPYKTCLGGVCDQEKTEVLSCACRRDTDGLCCGSYKECLNGECVDDRGVSVFAKIGSPYTSCEQVCEQSFGCGCVKTLSAGLLCYSKPDCSGVTPVQGSTGSWGCWPGVPLDDTCFNCSGSDCPTGCLNYLPQTASYKYNYLMCDCYHCCP